MKVLVPCCCDGAFVIASGDQHSHHFLAVRAIAPPSGAKTTTELDRYDACERSMQPPAPHPEPRQPPETSMRPETRTSPAGFGPVTALRRHGCVATLGVDRTDEIDSPSALI
jgi:hypothetical protein